LGLLETVNINHWTSQNPLESRDQYVVRRISFFYVITQLFNADLMNVVQNVNAQLHNKLASVQNLIFLLIWKQPQPQLLSIASRKHIRMTHFFPPQNDLINNLQFGGILLGHSVCRWICG
jgi:hypothetical protein